MTSLEKLIKHSKNYFSPLLIGIFLIFFVPRIIALGSDMSNYDASFWYPRMDRFTENLLAGQYKGTYQQYHPGVVLMLISGTSKYLFQQLFEFVFHFNPRFIPHQFIKLQIASILPLVTMISILGTLICFYLKEIVNKRFAIIFALVLSLEPFFLGVSKYLHLSALTSMLMFSSFLTLYYYYNKNREKKFLFYLSAILLGLGILTKIDAAIAGPVNVALIIFSEYRNNKFKELFLNLGLYGFTIIGVFYILFPAMWVAPIWVIDKIFSEGIQETAFDSSGGGTFTHIKSLYYFETFFLRSLPTSSLTFIAGIAAIVFNRKKYTWTENKFFYWTLGFLLFNLATLTIPEKTKDRYLINLYPAMLFICTIAFYEISKIKQTALKFGLIGLSIFIYSFALVRYYPVYSFYYTEFIAGPSGITRLGLNIKNRGEFYAQAAEHINTTAEKPEETNAVITHREQVRTFQPFYYGTLYTNPGLLPDGATVDYIISRPDMNYLIPHDYCELDASFGPKDPWGYKEIFVFKCDNMDNNFGEFRN